MPQRIVVTLLALALLATPGPARAAWAPAGVDLARPRILFRAGDEATVQSRLGREPYATIFRTLIARSDDADGVALDDHAIESERVKARAAKDLAFLYAIDRTLVAGSAQPFATDADRAAVGTRVQALLVAMYTRDRLAVPAPLGGWDRDISTSEELIQYATAYDTMLGAGWDFGTDRATIERNIVDLASELYENYVDPASASGFSRLHQNNHRAKSGAAMVVAALAVAEYTPAPGSDRDGVRDPALWLEYGLDQVDLIMRWVLVTGDGAYGEGPFYLRYASQNLIPFARAWDRLTGGATWSARGVQVPSLWRHPLWARTQRWMLDMTMPDGSLAPIDDGNVGRSSYFGLAPPGLPWASALAWRWTNQPQPLDTDGNVDLAADALVQFDDTVPAAPPEGPRSAFYYAGGNAIFRSGWDGDAIVANVQAEHDTASEFGRDRAGLGVSPESHEHAEPGAFMLYAFGEALAIDPGYLSFSQHGLVNQPEDHNLILVDGKGPVDYLSASLQWASAPAGPPPADGQAYLSDALDGPFLDAATVRTTYGLPLQRQAQIERRFLFPDDRYLVAMDEVASPGGPPRSYTWLLHGNGGGTSGGSFSATAHGGEWTRPRARLDVAFALDGVAPAFASATGQHEAPGNVLSTHEVLSATASGDRLRAIEIAYPTRSSDPAPVVDTPALASGAALTLTDATGDRRVLALHRAASPDPLVVPGSASGLGDVATDGVRALFDAHLDGRLRLAWAEQATGLTYAGTEYLHVATPALLGIALGDGRADVVVDDGAPEIAVRGLPFRPQAADGACSLADDGGGTVTLGLSRERRVTLRATAGNSAPAADPGPDRYVALGARVALDASASCDRDGDALTASWELVEAPAGASWQIDDAGTARPSFVADVRGIFRLRLTVTDAHGAASLPHDLVVRAVAPDEDPDGDLVPSDVDDCPAVADPEQRDLYPAGGNGVGDACECSDGGCVAGGGAAAYDCALELRPLGGATVEGGKVRCRDGDACDADPAPGVCGLDVLLCLANQDAAEPACTSFPPVEVRVRNWTKDGTPALLAALAALPGATAGRGRTVVFDPPLATLDTCTAPLRLTVPRPGRTLVLATRGSGRREVDADRIRFVCE